MCKQWAGYEKKIKSHQVRQSCRLLAAPRLQQSSQVTPAAPCQKTAHLRPPSLPGPKGRADFQQRKICYDLF